MKYLSNYLQFNEAVSQSKITDEILIESKKVIENWFSQVQNIPIDVNKDKLINWYAKNIKNYLLTYLSNQQNINFNNGYKDKSKLYTLVINYIKGKITKEEYELNKTKLFLPRIETIDEFIKNIYNEIDYETNFNSIKDYIFSDVRNQEIWKIDYNSSFEGLSKTSEEWHETLKASSKINQENGTVLIEYPNGFYWIDLESNNCREEGKAMGHCGVTSADTLLSLRQRKKDGSIEPYVTIAINDNKGNKYETIYQCKGKNNKKPNEKYHRYIIDLYIKYKLGVEKNKREYSSEDDFAINDLNDELFRKVLNEFPDLAISNIMSDDRFELLNDEQKKRYIENIILNMPEPAWMPKEDEILTKKQFEWCSDELKNKFFKKKIEKEYNISNNEFKFLSDELKKLYIEKKNNINDEKFELCSDYLKMLYIEITLRQEKRAKTYGGVPANSLTKKQTKWYREN
jgi:hypothetical protein